MIDKKIVNDFATIIGNIEIAINLKSLAKVKEIYQSILKELLNWIQYYYKNKNLNIVTHDASLKIYTSLVNIKDEILFDKKIGMESLLTDDILIRYEIIIKTINEARGV